MNSKLKRAALALFAGFLVFAPPGTLIVLALALVGIFGKTGALIMSGLALLALVALWMRRRKAAQGVKKS